MKSISCVLFAVASLNGWAQPDGRILSNNIKGTICPGAIRSVTAAVETRPSWGGETELDSIGITAGMAGTAEIFKYVSRVMNEIKKQKAAFRLYPSGEKISLSGIRDGQPSCASQCSDCTTYLVRFTFVTRKGTYSCSYRLDSGMESTPVDHCEGDLTVSQRQVSEWLHVFRLSRLLLPEEHELNRRFFGENNLQKVKQLL